MIKKWTKKETEILKTNMDSTLNTLKTLLPDRSEDQIIEKIRLLYRNESVNKWTDEEIEVITNSSPRTPIIDLMKLLPNRSYSAIKMRRYMVHGEESLYGTRPIKWTDKEIEALQRMKKEGYTNYEIADALGRPLNSVQGKLSYTNYVKRTYDKRNWSMEELQTVRDCIDSGNVIDSLVDTLNRDLHKLYNKALHLGYSPNQILTQSKLDRGERAKVIEILRDKYDSRIKDYRQEIRVLKFDKKTGEKEIIKLEKKIARLEKKLALK